MILSFTKKDNKLKTYLALGTDLAVDDAATKLRVGGKEPFQVVPGECGSISQLRAHFGAL